MENHLASSAAPEPGVLTPDVTMIILTWVAFISLLIILHKYAWKPILQGLQEREDSIRKAVDYVDQAKQELVNIESKRKEIIAQANSLSKELIENSRKGAVEAAKLIHEKAKDEAKILLENALREIKEEKGKAQADLRAESARVAVALAGKLIEANLDDERNRKLIDQLIKEI